MCNVGGSEAVKSGKLDTIKHHLGGDDDQIEESNEQEKGKVFSKLLTNAHRFYSNIMTDAEKQVYTCFHKKKRNLVAKKKKMIIFFLLSFRNDFLIFIILFYF
jgi:hypothetical protein